MARAPTNGLVLIAGIAIGGGCDAPALPASREPPVVRVEPAPARDGVATVLRLHVSGLGLPPGALVLFRGSLDSYHAARVRSAALPSTLDELLVASTVWSMARVGAPATTELVLAPVAPLAAGETYTAAALGFGVLTSFVVGEGAVDYAARVWPPAAAPHAGTRWVFCGEGAMPPPGGVVVLQPAELAVVVGAGADSRGAAPERCIHFDALAPPGPIGDSPVQVVAEENGREGGAPWTDAGGKGHAEIDRDRARIAVPPPLLEGLALDPSPVTLDLLPPESAQASGDASSADLVGASCDAGAVTLGPGCLRALDDRAFVKGSSSPLLWVFTDPTSRVDVSWPARELVVGGLPPGSRVWFRGTVTDVAGNEAAFDQQIATRPAEPHLVVNEVLANPSGVERTSEWVELYNDGSLPVELGGWSLADSTGSTALPRGSIAPGAYALVVPAGFDPGSSVDIPPAAGTLLLRVPALGSGGLSNQGEALHLRDPTDTVVSTFPALPAAKPGISMSRRSPASVDDDPTAFGASAPPGASPGGPNVIDGG